jgi:hypothetical protein
MDAAARSHEPHRLQDERPRELRKGKSPEERFQVGRPEPLPVLGELKG